MKKKQMKSLELKKKSENKSLGGLNRRMDMINEESLKLNVDQQ